MPCLKLLYYSDFIKAIKLTRVSFILQDLKNHIFCGFSRKDMCPLPPMCTRVNIL